MKKTTKKEKSIDYQQLAESYEILIDRKNAVIKTYDEQITSLNKENNSLMGMVLRGINEQEKLELDRLIASALAVLFALMFVTNLFI